MASQSLESRGLKQNLEGLFNCPHFYGELSKNDATEILNEAVANDGESLDKRILYIQTTHSLGRTYWKFNYFEIMEAVRIKRPDDIQPKFHFTEIQKWNSLKIKLTGSTRHYVERKNPFSLQVLAILATVKAASCNLESQQLPTRIEEEVQRYQDLNGAIKANWDYKLKFIKSARK